MIPSFTSEKEKTASGAAIAMSAAATRPAPPPSACPCTRATTGAGQESIASSIARSAFASATFSSYESSADARIHSTSAPAEKLGPSPASTTARARPTSTNASASSEMTAASNALRRSGRASVMRRTSPSRSVRRFFGHGEELRVPAMLRGAVAAAVTPLRDERFDAAAVAPYVDFLVGHGVDGLLALGTTGEGVLFSPARAAGDRAGIRRRGDGADPGCRPRGRADDADTVALAAHAAEVGADAVAVIAPPYFPLDEEELLAHFEAAAARVRARAVLRSTSSRRGAATRSRSP